jgi:gliding motility-associated-like protein
MKGQAPVADFKADVVTGCSPLSVNFKDLSTGSPKSWYWDFGNGTLSSAQNPNVNFLPGTYTIVFTVRNSDGISSTTKTNYIVSNPSPSASFSADKLLSCLPSTVQFKDLSVANAGTIVKWEWDLGDGTKSISQNPSHPYTTAGFYDIYLKVTSSTSCSSATSFARYIRIVNGVKADFSFTGPATCTPPFNVLYKNLTSGPGNLTYAWDLGNATSAQTSPTGTYPTAGTYTIKLTANSDFGCSDVIQKTIPITGSTTSFQTIGGKDTVCLGSAISFQSTASPTPTKVVWDFGDGSKFTGLVPPPKTYASPGTYTVTMNADFGNCSSTATKSIKVSAAPVVDFFSANNNSFCKAPAPVLFQNLSPDVATATWNFGDGGTSNSITPSVTHTYNATGNFAVTLNITDSKGCSNKVTKTNYVNILTPAVNIANLPAGVCVGQVFTPTPNVGTVDGIAFYQWDYGDGSGLTSVPTHTYAAAGLYTLTLNITTNGGCTGSSVRTNAVQVGAHSVVDFSKDFASVCRSKGVTFTNLSIPAGNGWLWDFGDGTTSILQNPLPPHKFPDTGFYSIKLKVTNQGCVDSATKTNFVRVQPPVANFGYTVPDCTNRSNVFFKDSSATNPADGAISYLWKFGDPGNNTNPTQNPSFTYPAVTSKNTYNVQLIVTNGVCQDTITKAVKLYNDSANFTINKTPAVYCRNENINLSTLNDYAYIKTFNWVVDGVPFVTDQGGHNIGYNITGNHTVQLITTDVNGCTNPSAVKPVSVTGPTALFSVGNKGGCSNSTITFNDASVSSGTLTKWVFNFGDGTPDQTFTAPPFTHKYASTGSYIVKLTVYDNTSNNCSDTYTDSAGAFITKPVASFGADKTVFCPGVPLQFNDSSAGFALTYAWNFGDGGTGNIQNPLHQYSGNDSVYTVRLVVKDSVGCTDTLIRSNYISVRTPKPLYTVKDTATLCPPLETKFAFTGKDVESFSWDFGDGGSSTLTNPNHFYNSYGKYTAKLYAVGYGGCIDSASINITLTDPIAATSVIFNPNPAQACNNLTVNFSVTPPYSTKFKFYFGDGSIDSSQQTSITHFYTLPNIYSPYVFLEDSVGCKVVKGGLGNINILGAVPLFGIDKKKFCDSGNVYFTDYSQDGHDAIVTRTWDFGDGSPAVVLPKDATNNYKQPGLYVPTLSVTTAAGCTQKFTDTVRVLATPRPVITSVNGICNNSFLDFAGSLFVPPDTAITWKWGFSNGQTASTQNISIKYTVTGLHHITLEATNSAGCKGDTAKDIMIYPLPVITVSGDTSIVSGGVGTIIPITYSANAVSYNWTPATNLDCTDCPNPFANPKYNTTYKVTVTDANGCVSSRNVTVLVVCNNKNFFIPNTFSPNNDGANDRFYPRGTGLNLIQSLRIFNRWGEMVFEKRNFPANDASSGWDGTYKGKAAGTDTYIYMIDIICDNATIITYKGNVTLIR